MEIKMLFFEVKEREKNILRRKKLRRRKTENEKEENIWKKENTFFAGRRRTEKEKKENIREPVIYVLAEFVR